MWVAAQDAHRAAARRLQNPDRIAMSRSLLSLGSINADFQVRVDEAPGRSELLAGRDLRRLSGGKAANVAMLARRLGHEVRLFGRVGDDDLAEQVLGPLRAAGVDLSGVRQRRGDGTSVAMVMVPPDGKQRIVAASRANLDFDAADIDAIEHGIAGADAGSVLVVDYEITPLAASRAIAAARRRGLRVVIDPSPPGVVDKADLAQATALTPNESEALTLTGIKGNGPDAILDAAHALARLGPPLVCIKLDDGGCLLLHEKSAWHQRAAPVDVVDTTGAGDAFTAAFAVALLEEQPPLQSAAFAVAASELAATGYGAQPAYPDREQLEAQLRSARRSLTRWGH
jgi:ribokinase